MLRRRSAAGFVRKIESTLGKLGLTASRSFFATSEQNKALENNANFYGYDSNLWIEDSTLTMDRRMKEAGVAPKNGERPTSILHFHPVEFINVDDLIIPPQMNLPSAGPDHINAITGKSLANSKHLEKMFVQRGLKRRVWITPSSAKKYNCVMRSRSVTHSIVFHKNGKYFNVCQCSNSDFLKMLPCSAATGKLITNSEAAKAFQQHQAKNGFRTGLAFLSQHALALSLTVKDECTGQKVTRMTSNFYNVEQLADPNGILEGTAAVGEHTNIITKRTISFPRSLLAAMDIAGFASKYWISHQDIERRNLTIIDGAKPIEAGGINSNDMIYFNAEEFTDPRAAFAAVCTLVR